MKERPVSITYRPFLTLNRLIQQAAPLLGANGVQCLFNIGNDVVDVFNAH